MCQTQLELNRPDQSARRSVGLVSTRGSATTENGTPGVQMKGQKAALHHGGRFDQRRVRFGRLTCRDYEVQPWTRASLVQPHSAIRPSDSLHGVSTGLSRSASPPQLAGARSASRANVRVTLRCDRRNRIGVSQFGDGNDSTDGTDRARRQGLDVILLALCFWGARAFRRGLCGAEQSTPAAVWTADSAELEVSSGLRFATSMPCPRLESRCIPVATERSSIEESNSPSSAFRFWS